MSHQTGIQASDELRKFFAQAKSGDVRLIKVSIEEEQLVLAHSEPAIGTWEEDYDRVVGRCLRDKEPCYILYRKDKKVGDFHQWIFIAYCPDFSPVRQKMLYAATRATLKTEFGGSQIADEVFGTVPDDVLLEGYKKHLAAENAPAPLTMAEEELEYIKKQEVNTHIGVDTKHQTMTGIAFPMSNDAVEKLNELKHHQINYVQLSLDVSSETINLEKADDTGVERLPAQVPEDHPRYHFFNFKHTHEGDYLQSIVFIYSMPGYKCSIKERMLYSSCKGPLVESVEDQLGMEIAKKLEIDDANELTEEFLQDALHPKKNIATAKFARPKGPAGRGPKRLTKGSKGGSDCAI